LDVIIRGNKQEMEDYTDMCEALYELFADELKENRAQGLAEGKAAGRIERMVDGRAQEPRSLSKPVLILVSPERILYKD
jgi:hypothetical protein